MQGRAKFQECLPFLPVVMPLLLHTAQGTVGGDGQVEATRISEVQARPLT